MLGDDGVLPSGAALASDDSFAPMVKLGRAASSFPGNFYEAEGTALLNPYRRANRASAGNTLASYRYVETYI